MQKRATPSSRLVDVLPASPKVLAEWNPFSLFVVDATPLHASIAFGDLALGLYTAGRYRIRRRMGRRGVEIVPQFLARDRVMEAVMTRLALKAHHGSRSDSLYVESACEFLAHHIVDVYSSLSKSEPRYSGGLGRRLNAVVDYIEANLAR